MFPTASIEVPSLSPARRGAGAGPIAIAAVLTLPALALLLASPLAASLQFDRDAIASGQLWRLVTCHWTHWSGEHLAWDVAVFIPLAFACAVRCPRRFAWTLTISTIAIPLAVWFAEPGLATYRGLSGIDSALLLLLMVDVFADGPREVRRACGALLVAFTAKVVYEALTGDCVFVSGTTSEFVPVPLAHAAGGIVGALTGLVGRGALSNEIVATMRRRVAGGRGRPTGWRCPVAGTPSSAARPRG